MAANLVRRRWLVRDLLQLPVPEGGYGLTPLRLLKAAAKQIEIKNRAAANAASARSLDIYRFILSQNDSI